MLSITLDGDGVLLWVAESPPADRDLISQTAREFRLVTFDCRPAEVFDTLGGHRCRLVAIDLDGDGQALATLRQVRERFPHLPLLAVSSNGSTEAIRAAVTAGASDFLLAPLTAPAFHKALVMLSQSVAKPAHAPAVSGEVVTVCGARGGLGITTLAVNLAVQLRNLTESEVALVDLDLQRGDVTAFLNLTPLNSLATLASARGDMDEMALRNTLIRHTSGVFVMSAPLAMEDAEAVGHDDVAATLGVMRTLFRYIVIDTPRLITGPVLAAFEHSDRILIGTDLSVPGLRAARRMLDLLERLHLSAQHIEVFVTHAVPGPVALAEVSRSLGRDPVAVIPRDDTAANTAMNEGIPLNGRPSRLGEAITGLAMKIAAVDADPTKRPKPLLQRLLGRGRKAKV